MNKKLLALSVAAAIGGVTASGVAQAALEFNQDGVGHILIQPYFTAQNGNDTLINLVNTDTANGKAVKVRFRSAGNSDDVLDFQVFLSPGDVWTASVTEGDDGRAVLKSSDKSCTLPAIPEAGVSFITQNLPPNASDEVKAEWTREGYVEFLNMGDITESTVSTSLYKNIKHVNGVAPCDQTRLVEINKTADLVPPTTGLASNWIVINVPTAASWAGEAVAIEATDATNVVYYKQDDSFAVAKGAPAAAVTADPIFVTKDVANFDLPDLSTPYDAAYATAVQQANALADALAVTQVANEFLTVSDIAAETDWVFSMPTRRYQVAVVYDADDASANTLAFTAGAVHFTTSNTKLSGNLACVALSGVKSYDQEERGSAAAGAVFSPGTIEIPRFCGEGTVLKFNGSDVLGASVATASVSTGFDAGWTVINTNNGGNGLPVLGQSFVKATNSGVAAGTSGNFGAGFAHRVARP
ncbi:MAG: cell surface protein [Thauera sp.]|jgi:hypothetical protein|nr:cell surface protein [Thauera sp.]